MPHRLRTLLVVAAGAWLAGFTVACSSEPASPPAEPAAAATPAEPAAPAEPTAAEPAVGTPADESAASEREQTDTSKYTPPLRGTAEIAYTTPKTQVKNNVVITTITVRNVSTGSIAGLKIEEYWWDKSSNPVTGDSIRLSKPLMPGETTTITLETPKDPRMFRNTYVFRHAFGQIKATLQKSLE